MRRLLVSVLMVAIFVAGAFGLTQSFFSDTETAVGNTFQAGAVDLKIDNTSYYNGEFNQETSWEAADIDGSDGPSTDGTYRFFDFHDIKPSDWGEDTISIRVDTNNAWGCYEVNLTSNDDNTCTEPELLDDQSCTEPGEGEGELADLVEFVFWLDDGDNVFEDGEQIIQEGTVTEAFPSLNGALADSDNGILGLEGEPMTGEQTYYIGKAWCFGNLTLDAVEQDGDGFLGNEGANGPDIRNSGLTCDGSNLNNASQTDTLTADISFSAVQSRNNPNFLCGPPWVCEPGETTYANAVESSSQGSLKNGDDITDSARIDATDATGAPDGQFFSLGDGGEIVLYFNTPIVDGEGDDISVHEITNGRASYPEEKADVWVSEDGISFTFLGESSSEPNGVGDGDGVSFFEIPDELEFVQYVKLIDSTDYGPHGPTADGFDLDAVDAVYGACEEPQ